MVDFRDRAKGRATRLRHSLLRANRHLGTGAARERPAPLRRSGALPAGRGAKGAGGRIHFGRDPALVLRLFAIDSDFAALEKNCGTKDDRTECQDRTTPKHAGALEEARNLLRV